MKIRSVKANNRKKAFEVTTYSKRFVLPYALAEPRPAPGDRVVRAVVDKDLAREGFVFTLDSGEEGTIHIEQVLAYNDDPAFLRDRLLYALTLEAQKHVESSPLAKREIIRRLGTSATQLYRLLDQTNYRKSVDQMLNLLHVLGCEIDLVVRERKRKAPPRVDAAAVGENSKRYVAKRTRRSRS